MLVLVLVLVVVGRKKIYGKFKRVAGPSLALVQSGFSLFFPRTHIEEPSQIELCFIADAASLLDFGVRNGWQ